MLFPLKCLFFFFYSAAFLCILALSTLLCFQITFFLYYFFLLCFFFPLYIGDDCFKVVFSLLFHRIFHGKSICGWISVYLDVSRWMQFQILTTMQFGIHILKWITLKQMAASHRKYILLGGLFLKSQCQVNHKHDKQYGI